MNASKQEVLHEFSRKAQTFFFPHSALWSPFPKFFAASILSGFTPAVPSFWNSLAPISACWSHPFFQGPVKLVIFLRRISWFSLEKQMLLFCGLYRPFLYLSHFDFYHHGAHGYLWGSHFEDGNGFSIMLIPTLCRAHSWMVPQHSKRLQLGVGDIYHSASWSGWLDGVPLTSRRVLSSLFPDLR